MQISDIPSLLQKPFADSGTKNTIPVASQTGVTPGAASLTDGFPPLTMTPLAAGGVPPYGADFNGILNWLSKICQWANAGGQYVYDSAFATAIGGYAKGSVLLKADYSGSWVSTVDSNTSDPDSGGEGWTTYGGMAYVDTAPPDQVNGTDLVYAKDRDQILRWQTIGTFTGYASPLVGLFHWGTTTPPRPFEELLIGATIDSTLAKYKALIAWANAQGLVVDSGSWEAGTYNFGDNGDGTIILPDLRNQFIRATGTDADTANARSLGSAQLDAIQNIIGEMDGVPAISGAFTGAFSGSSLSQNTSKWAATSGSSSLYDYRFKASGSARTSSETRGKNVSLSPMVCL